MGTELAKQARATRVQRETAEMGRRQAELALRRRQEEVFLHLAAVHKQTVQSYVEDLFYDVAEDAACAEALRQVGNTHEAGKTGKAMDGQLPEDVMRDLVASCLTPELPRGGVRDKVELAERKYVEAAQKSIFGLMAQVELEVEDKNLTGNLARPDVENLSPKPASETPTIIPV